MSRRLPNPQANYGNNYLPYPGGPRDIQNEVLSSDPEHHHSRNFSQLYMPSYRLPRHRDGHRPLLPSTHQEEAIRDREDWYTPAQIDAMHAYNTRHPRRPAEGYEPFGTRGKKLVRDQKPKYPVVDILFKQAGLHGQHPESTMTLFHNQIMDMGKGNISQNAAPKPEEVRVSKKPTH